MDTDTNSTNPSSSHPASPTTERKRYHSVRQQARQANILAVTREMLAEVGYEATTIRNLAERAHVAPGTIYNLYKSKDELIVAAVSDLLDAIGEQAQARAKEGIPLILAMGEETADAILDNPQYAHAMAKAVFRADQDDPLNAALYSRTQSFFAEQLRFAQQCGQVVPMDTEELLMHSNHLVAQTWGCVMGWTMGLFQLEQIKVEYLRVFSFVLRPLVSPAVLVELDDWFKHRRWDTSAEFGYI